MKGSEDSNEDNKRQSPLKALSTYLKPEEIVTLTAISTKEWNFAAFSAYEADINRKLQSLFRNHCKIYGVIVIQRIILPITSYTCSIQAYTSIS